MDEIAMPEQHVAFPRAKDDGLAARRRTRFFEMVDIRAVIVRVIAKTPFLDPVRTRVNDERAILFVRILASDP